MSIYNEVGGQNLFNQEPEEFCPKCGERMYADFVDNGFGPYSVQIGPYYCDSCNWLQGGEDDEHHGKI